MIFIKMSMNTDNRD